MNFYDVDVKDAVYEKTEEILDKVFRFTFSSDSVGKIYKEIVSGMFGLKIFPYRYPRYNNKYRVLVLSREYVVFYRVDEELKKVTIVYLFSTKENYEEEII